MENKVVAADVPRWGDFWGGLATMLVALPAAIAFGVSVFSQLPGEQAALGAVAGMIGAAILGLVPPWVGGAPRTICAPCAPAAAVLAGFVATLAEQGISAPVILLMLTLTGLVTGALQIGLGLSRIGRLIRYIPYPVVSGYMSGVGLIMIGSQLPKLLGVPAGTTLWTALAHPADWQWQAMTIGISVISVMYFAPRWATRVPAAVLALAAGGIVYGALALIGVVPTTTHNNALVVGALQQGSGLLETLRQNGHAMMQIGLRDVALIFAPAATLAVLLSIDGLKTCVIIDTLTQDHHDSNRTLVGQGLGNMAATLFGGIPGSATLGASLVNIDSGGVSSRASLVAGSFALAALLFLSSAVAWIPIAALAALLLVVGARMIDRHSISFFLTADTRLDFAVILAVVLVALFGDLVVASGVGVALSILSFTREQTRASVIRHRIEGSDLQLRRRTPAGAQAVLPPDLVIMELQGSLFFGTANQLQGALETELGKHRYVLLNMRRVQSLDVTATHVLELFKARLEAAGGQLIFCDLPKGLPSGLKMKRFLKATGVVGAGEKAMTFAQVEDALAWIDAQTAQQANAQGASAVLALTDFSCLSGLSTATQSALAATVDQRTYKAGEKLYKSGTVDRELLLVRSGAIRVNLPIRKKQSYRLSTCIAGDLIGGMSFLQGGGHTTTAEALVDSAAFVLPYTQFVALVAQYSDLEAAIFRAIAEQLGERLHVAAAEIQALRR